MGITISDAVKDLIINGINIIVLFLIVRTLAYQPVKKYLDARTDRIDRANREAQEKKAEADALAQQYNNLLENSREEGAELLRKVEKTAGEQAEQILKNAEKKADEIVGQARVKAEKEHDRMLASAKEDVTELAFRISEKVLSREISQSDNQKIVDEFFAAEPESDGETV